MARTLIFIMMTFALSVMLLAAGITTGNENNTVKIIMQITEGKSLLDTDLGLKIVAAFLIIAGAAAITAFTFGNANAATVMGSMFIYTILVNFISDFIYIINVRASSFCGDNVGFGICSDWVYNTLVIIFIPIIGGLLWSLYDFVTGNDQ